MYIVSVDALPCQVVTSKGTVYMYMFLHVHVHAHFDCLGCAVLICLVVCLTLLASFFLPSHLSFKNMYKHIPVHVQYTCKLLLCISPEPPG